jgi:hypothetical protein
MKMSNTGYSPVGITSSKLKTGFLAYKPGARSHALTVCVQILTPDMARSSPAVQGDG